MRASMKAIADNLLLANLVWYLVLACAFGMAGAYPKSIYFLGAAVLTVGVVMM
jgi:hypothetical protein